MAIPERRIRRATSDDAAAIASVRIDTWRSAYRGILPDALLDGLDPVDSTASWRRGLEAPSSGRVAYVAEVAARVVGFVTAGPERSRNAIYPGEVYALYVRDAHQGQGIGRALVRIAAAELVPRGLSPILIWTLHGNPKSRAWYEALGGTLVGEKRELLGRHELREVGYGWLDPAPLLGEKG